MFSKTVSATFAAVVIISTSLTVATPAFSGPGDPSIPLGDHTELCIGFGCPFTYAPDYGRDGDRVADHRGENTTDHRDASDLPQNPPENSRENTTVRVGPQVRDHRTPPPTVRDHRSGGQNEIVPTSARRYGCDTGNVILNRMGYRAVVAYDCEGARYHYTARDGASMFHAEMNAYTTEMEVVFVGIAQ